ncbi:hypothetical protein K435DRAFT_695996, partial [Dendrothele bispora CBS 962.96]
MIFASPQGSFSHVHCYVHPSTRWDGRVYIILFGTDHLEILFGLVCTAVGMDCNVDTLQFGNQVSGLTEVAVIHAIHPEWDQVPRRLKVPAYIKAGEKVPGDYDHLNPPSWRGDTRVSNVNLWSCWLAGYERAIKLVPDAHSALE